MKLDLPEDVMKSLPDPASDGLVRVTVGLKMAADGSLDLAEVNDMPVPMGGEEENPTEDAAEPTEEDGAPDLGAMAADIYGPSTQ